MFKEFTMGMNFEMKSKNKRIRKSMLQCVFNKAKIYAMQKKKRAPKEFLCKIELNSPK